MSPDDERAIDRVVGAFYAAFDNRDGRTPDLEALRALFTADAVITRVAPAALDSWRFDDFARPRVALLRDGTLTDFHEWETAGEMVGGTLIASRRSAYAKAGYADGEPFAGEGRKLIQLCKSGERWLIASVLWEDGTG